MRLSRAAHHGHGKNGASVICHLGWGRADLVCLVTNVSFPQNPTREIYRAMIAPGGDHLCLSLSNWTWWTQPPPPPP